MKRGAIMELNIRPSADLRNKYNEILFMIIAESNESRSYHLSIYDLTILDIE